MTGMTAMDLEADVDEPLAIPGQVRQTRRLALS